MEWLSIILGVFVVWGFVSLFKSRRKRLNQNNIHAEHGTKVGHEHKHSSGHGGCCH